MRFRFERLQVWQSARALNRAVYRVSSVFPENERFGLVQQIRRASVSVSSNIAEGSGRNSDKDFAHFLEQAYGSLMEVASQLFLALVEDYISEAQATPILEEMSKLAAQIAALNRSLQIPNSKVRLRK